MARIFSALLGSLIFLSIAARLLVFASVAEMMRSILNRDELDPAFMRDGLGEIVKGENKKSLSKLAKRLRAISAQPSEAATNRSVHIAIIDGLPSASPSAQPAATPKIVVDFANAGDAAAVLFKMGAVILRVENASPDQRAKIGVEGGGPFDMENAPEGLLAGFRIDAFGGEAALPRDYLDRTDPDGPFCRSIRQWASLYRVGLGAMRIYVFRSPTRINILQNRLSGSPDPRFSPTWTAGIECRDRSYDRVRSKLER